MTVYNHISKGRQKIFICGLVAIVWLLSFRSHLHQFNSCSMIKSFCSQSVFPGITVSTHPSFTPCILSVHNEQTMTKHNSSVNHLHGP